VFEFPVTGDGERGRSAGPADDHLRRYDRDGDVRPGEMVGVIDALDLVELEIAGFVAVIEEVLSVFGDEGFGFAEFAGDVVLEELGDAGAQGSVDFGRGALGLLRFLRLREGDGGAE